MIAGILHRRISDEDNEGLFLRDPILVLTQHTGQCRRESREREGDCRRDTDDSI